MASAQAPYFADFSVGANGDPTGKINDFNSTIRQTMSNRVDVAFFKFCYVDINANTNYQTLFNYYKSTMDALERDYPSIKFIHVTQPLTVANPADNANRERYNVLMRQNYGASGRLFDLAKAESTDENGNRISGTYSGSTYYSLYSTYASDNGHLNTTGGDAAAKEMLTIIAGTLR